MIRVYCDLCKAEIPAPLPPPKGGGRWVYEPYLTITVKTGRYAGDEEPVELEKVVEQICATCADRVTKQALAAANPE